MDKLKKYQALCLCELNNVEYALFGTSLVPWVLGLEKRCYVYPGTCQNIKVHSKAISTIGCHRLLPSTRKHSYNAKKFRNA